MISESMREKGKREAAAALLGPIVRRGGGGILRKGSASARLLVGRKIAAVEMNPFPDGRGGTAHNPVITLDNGATVTFVVDETEGSDYGITAYYWPKRGAR